MRTAVAVAVALAIAACGSAAPPCDRLDARACTQDRRCILDRGSADAIVCRAAIGCELVVHELDLVDFVEPPVTKPRPSEYVRRCEAHPECRYEDRGCFCPCNLSGFPTCNCDCGGGLPRRCAPRK